MSRSTPGPADFKGNLPYKVRPLTTAEQVADTCGLMIVEGRILAGERLGEEMLAEMCGVSRGPVREALRILEKRRLVEIVPRRGAFVREVTLATIADLFNVRNALSGMAAANMARRCAASVVPGAEARPGPVTISAAEDLDRLDQRVVELRSLVAEPDCQPLEFSYQMTRIVFAVILGSGNALLRDIWRDLNQNTFWTTIWKVPQDGRTAGERQQRMAQIDETVAAIHAGDVVAAEMTIRHWLDEIRDQVMLNLSANRPSGIR